MNAINYIDEQEGKVEKKKGSIATMLLIIACIVCYPIGLQRGDYYACSYYNVFTEKHWWVVFTALFVHGNLLHMIVNMLFLFLFGRGLEKNVGPFKLLLVFLIGGAASMYFSIFYYDGPVVGASGSISTILATLMLFDPWKFSLLLNLFPMPIGVAGFTYIVLNFAGLYMDAKQPSAGGTHTAYMGHISGFVAGIFLGMALSPNWKKNLVISIIQFILFYVLLLAIIHFTNR